MKHHDDLPYLRHIVDAALRVAQYVKGLDEASFKDNPLVQDGVIRQIMVIGEAVKLLSDEVRVTYTQVPWRQIARMRDTLVHRYFGIDLEEVWLTAKDDLPALKATLSAIIQDIEAHDDGE